MIKYSYTVPLNEYFKMPCFLYTYLVSLHINGLFNVYVCTLFDFACLAAIVITFFLSCCRLSTSLAIYDTTWKERNKYDNVKVSFRFGWCIVYLSCPYNEYLSLAGWLAGWSSLSRGHDTTIHLLHHLPQHRATLSVHIIIIIIVKIQTLSQSY